MYRHVGVCMHDKVHVKGYMHDMQKVWGRVGMGYLGTRASPVSMMLTLNSQRVRLIHLSINSSNSFSFSTVN